MSTFSIPAKVLFIEGVVLHVFEVNEVRDCSASAALGSRTAKRPQLSGNVDHLGVESIVL
ncbi:MAG: hypothetical protein R2788_24675 [Saprospiraceae bacterium]